MNTRTPIYIFDLDGTLADIRHRLHYIERAPKRYDLFFEACVDDKPNLPVTRILDTLQWENEILIFSGRSEVVRSKTIRWLYSHTNLSQAQVRVGLRMRASGDYTPDHELKRKWLHEMSQEQRSRIVGVFDDRDRLVRMWREEGLTCFQVAEGNF